MIDVSILKCPICTNKLCQDNTLFYCKDCDFEYFHNVATATVAVIQKDKKILLLTRAKQPKQGELHLPGGFVSNTETAEDALKREVKEETNLEVINIKYLFSIPNKYKYSNILYNVLDLYFEVEVANFKIELDDESIEYDWFLKSKIQAEKVAFSSVKQALTKLGYLV